MVVRAANFSDCGGRECNEDSCLVVNHNNKLCVIVADGLGGHGGGNLASQAAVDTVKNCFEAKGENEDVTADDMDAWFDAANEAVLGLQTKDCEMKTTLAVLCLGFGKDEAVAAHAGDTRIYHFIDNKLSYISFDHSVSRMAVLSGEISMDGIRFHADRNRLLRALGAGDEIHAETKFLNMEKTSNHAFLLCTDGFWEYVTEPLMEEMLKKSATPKEWLSRMHTHLKAVAKDGNDNNTAAAVFITR